MNDVERRLKRLGERVGEDVARELRPRPESLRRIRRRRLLASTSVLACAATIAAAAAFAWTGGSGRSGRIPPAGETPAVETGRCAPVPFEPTYVPARFGRKWAVPREARPGLLRVLYGGRAAAIELTTPHHAFVQTRPRHIRVLGEPATIGLIHEGYSVEFHHHGCDYVLNGYGITKDELKRFATGLVETRVVPAGDPAMVVWPEDTIEHAVEACAGAAPRERTNPQVVSGFAMDVLGWESPIYEAPQERSGPWIVYPSERSTIGGKVDAGVRVWTTEVAPGCWSIRSVSRLADRRPTGVAISVDGQIVEVGYAPLGAAAATIEVGYGGRTRRVYDRIVQRHVRIWLRFTPETTGHFLVMLRDEDGDVFAAYAAPLPAGDFTAG